MLIINQIIWQMCNNKFQVLNIKVAFKYMYEKQLVFTIPEAIYFIFIALLLIHDNVGLLHLSHNIVGIKFNKIVKRLINTSCSWPDSAGSCGTSMVGLGDKLSLSGRNWQNKKYIKQYWHHDIIYTYLMQWIYTLTHAMDHLNSILKDTTR